MRRSHQPLLMQASSTRPVCAPCVRYGAGFSLVELIAVILIIGVLAGLAIPRLIERDTFDQQILADRMVAALRLAQRSAQARNRDVCVTVTANQISFSMAQSAGTLQPCNTLFPVEPDDITPSVIEMPARYLTPAPASMRLSFTPNVSFRFTPAGPLGNIAAIPSFTSPAQTIAITRSLPVTTNTTTLRVHAANGYVSIP